MEETKKVCKDCQPLFVEFGNDMQEILDKYGDIMDAVDDFVIGKQTFGEQIDTITKKWKSRVPDE